MNKKISKNPLNSKQLTLDNLPKPANSELAKMPASTMEKRIVITGIGTFPKEDEVTIKIGFKLFPSKSAFSKVQLDLWFENQRIQSDSIRIPQGAMSADEFELTRVLDMKGVPQGFYGLKVEMYEFWSSGERFSQTITELTVDYVPQTRESKYVKVPSVKSVAETDLVVVSESDKNIYRGIEKTMKKESSSERDSW